MSTAAIHNSASAAPAAEGRAATSAPARPAQQAPSAAADTVHLTVAQQVYQLHNQGQRVSQIASSLNLSVAAVNNYLNISNSKG